MLRPYRNCPEAKVTKYNRDVHHRRSIRLKDYDYAHSGAYFVTICTHGKECLFGEVATDTMRLNDYGEIVTDCWMAIPSHFQSVELDEFIVMPNHVHGIVLIASNIKGEHPSGTMMPGSLMTIVRSFKAAATKGINELRQTPGVTVWQRNYYEHIIRSEAETSRIREYIAANPLKWSTDRENPLIT